MKPIRQFGSFWYHFIVGDDPRVAVAVIAGLAVTAYLTHVARLNTWWLLPALVVVMLTASLMLATRTRTR
jgi:hypothetical protein